MKIEDLIATLPDPTKDKKPPPAMVSKEGAELAKAQAAFDASLLDPKVDTENRVKYVLESLFGMKLKKDGDWKTYPNGRTVWQRKVSDYVGSTPAGGYNAHTYVEVKGVSPGNNLNLARIDRPNKKGEKSQLEKLTEADENGNFVILAIGWWIAPPWTEPVMIQQKSREITRWRREVMDLEIDIIEWSQFMGVYSEMKRRSIRRVDMKLFPPCRIFKFGNRWKLCDNHWWNKMGLALNPMYSGRIISGIQSNAGH